jgi:hypothetical protein
MSETALLGTKYPMASLRLRIATGLFPALAITLFGSRNSVKEAVKDVSKISMISPQLNVYLIICLSIYNVKKSGV